MIAAVKVRSQLRTLTLLLLTWGGVADAAAPTPEPRAVPPTLRKAPATRFSSLSPAQCRAELARRKIQTQPASRPAAGVATPVRLAGPLHGVQFITPGRRSVYGTLDCRLALALDEFARILAEHDVAAVHVDNLYRPKARLPGRRHRKSQHAYGLAVDIVALTLRDGRRLDVEAHWTPTLQTPPCDDVADASERSAETLLLRTIVCTTARQGVFHHMLTPNYDLAHRNHLHFDIARNARSFVLK